MNLEQRVRLGYGYLTYLGEKKGEYAIALTYRYPYCDEIAEMAMKAFVRKLLRRLPRRARATWGGHVCAERHTDVKYDGTYHFHFIIWGLDSVMPDAFEWLTKNAKRAASELYPREPSHLCDCAEAKKTRRRKTCKGGMSCRGPRMTDRKATVVQVIDHTPEKAYEYAVSDIYRLDRPAGGQLLDIGFDGVTGHLLNRRLL